MRFSSIVNVPRHSSGAPDFLTSSASECSESRTAQKKTKIIVVDDDSLIAESLADILNGEGFEVSAVFSGPDAIDWARRNQPDVLVSDVVMPGMNGIEAATSIREFLPQCRVILFSGQALTNNLLAEARAHGHTFEMLAKPVNPYSLLAALRSKREQ
ncbi:MAG TPA: response regulator [Terriglobia bacterium]|nr:response regulator [Terriglobia bacterium]